MKELSPFVSFTLPLFPILRFFLSFCFWLPIYLSLSSIFLAGSLYPPFSLLRRLPPNPQKKVFCFTWRKSTNSSGYIQFFQILVFLLYFLSLPVYLTHSLHFFLPFCVILSLLMFSFRVSWTWFEQPLEYLAPKQNKKHVKPCNRK